jgi:hypothetical protein
MNDVVIKSLTLLRDDAKARGVTTAQQQHLIIAYGRSLVRRLEDQAERRDEVRIALCMRAPPIFGFLVDDEKVCEVQGAVPVVDHGKHAVKVSGSIAGRVALSGEMKRFGVSAFGTLTLPEGQLLGAD